MSFEDWIDGVISELPTMERIEVDHRNKTIEIGDSLHCPPPSEDDNMSGIRFEECMDDKGSDAENIVAEIEFECERRDLKCKADYFVDMFKNDGITWVTVEIDGSKPRPNPSTVADMVRMWSSIPT